jgi:threonine synthase
VDVCVPCGNFGNILAAVYAKAMGVPFRDFTVAANKNNILSDFVMTGASEHPKLGKVFCSPHYLTGPTLHVPQGSTISAIASSSRRSLLRLTS